MPSTRENMIYEQIASSLDHLAPGARWHIDGPIGLGRKCEIFKLTNDQQSQTLALKVYRTDQISAAGPKVQFAALQRFTNDTAPELNVAVPKAHAFLPELNAIIMDWIDAPRLRTVLWRRTLSRGGKQTCVRNTAQWLRRFHNTSEIVSMHVNTQALLRILNKRIAQSAAAKDLMDHAPLFRDSMAALTQLSGDPRLIAPHVKLHGDFTPTNILVKGETVIGIDVWGARQGPAFEDIARMLTYLAIDTPFALNRCPLLNGTQENPLFATFLDGYGRDQISVEDPALWYILLYQQLRRWIVCADRISSNRSSFKSRLQLYPLRRLCENSLAHLTTIAR